MNVLIAGHRPSNLKLLRLILEGEGMHVREAANGVEALAALDQEPVDAIVSDILMPRMDGYRLCMEVRAHARFSEMPFVAYTASYTSASDEQLMMEMGADRFLRKPALSLDIAAVLRDVVRARRAGRPAAPGGRLVVDLLKDYNGRLVAKLEENNLELAEKIERLTRADAELRATHAKLQRFLDRSPAVLYELKWEDGCVLPQTVSENVESLLGFPVAEALSHEWWLRQLHPDDQARAVASIGETLAHGASRTEYRLRHRDGSDRWVDDQRRAVRDAQGTLVSLIGIWTDITARKQEAERDEQREQWRALVALSTDAVFIVQDERVAFANPAAAQLLAAARAEELIGRHISDFVHEDYLAEARMRTDQAGRQEGALPLRERRFRRADGTEIEIESTVVHVRFHARPAVLVEARDISERKRAERALQEAEHRYRATFEQAAVGILHTDVRGRLIDCNQRFADIVGRTREEVRTCTVQGIVHPDDLPAGIGYVNRLLAGELQSSAIELRYLHKAGATGWAKVTVSLARDAAGGPENFLTIVEDITARKQAEAALSASDERFRLISETIDEVFWMSNVELTRIDYLSPAFERVWGRRREEFLENPSLYLETVFPEDRPLVHAMLRQQVAGQVLSQRYRIVHPTGEVRWVWDRGFPVRDAAGQVTLYVGVVDDITERVGQEDELRRTKDRFQSIFENAIEGIYQSTPDGQLLTANPALARILGFDTPAELVAARTEIAEQGYVDAALRDEFKRRVEADGVVTGFRYEVRRKDGSAIWVTENARVVRDESGRVLCYEGSMEDITEIRRAELCLRLEHEVAAALGEGGSLQQTYQKVLAIVGLGLDWDLGELWTVERAGNALHCAETWHRGAEELASFAAGSRATTFARGVGLPGRVWATGQPERIVEVAREPACVRCGLAARRGLRGWMGFPIKLRHEVFGVAGFFSRRSLEPDEKQLAMLAAIGTQLGQFVERQHLADQYRQAQKMEAIGTLAGGIAHDFNNILGAINGYTELARMDAKGDVVVIEHLDAVLSGARRATDLVRQILAFSRQQEQERRPVQLRHIAAEAMRLLRAAVPATVKFETSLASDAPVVFADATQVHQILMNLGANAAHAMRERGGELTLELTNVVVDADFAAQQADLRVGRYACLTISDTGHGMDAATLERIFEPFFTTKPVGEGTGLGLAVVHGIVKAHDGAITVSSRPGEGTTFQVYFPAQFVDVEEAASTTANLPRGAGERILFVDDEAPIADIGRRVLDGLGYRTDTCCEAARAFELVAADPAAYALVIADQMMPNLTGLDLAQRLRVIRPGLPVILSTGYTSALHLDRLRAIGIRELLAKPFSVHALGTTVARVLAEAKPN